VQRVVGVAETLAKLLIRLLAILECLPPEIEQAPNVEDLVRHRLRARLELCLDILPDFGRVYERAPFAVTPSAEALDHPAVVASGLPDSVGGKRSLQRADSELGIEFAAREAEQALVDRDLNLDDIRDELLHLLSAPVGATTCSFRLHLACCRG